MDERPEVLKARLDQLRDRTARLERWMRDEQDKVIPVWIWVVGTATLIATGWSLAQA